MKDIWTYYTAASEKFPEKRAIKNMYCVIQRHTRNYTTCLQVYRIKKNKTINNFTARYMNNTEEFSYLCDCSLIISKPLKYRENSNGWKSFHEKTDIIYYCETPWLHEILPLFSRAVNKTQAQQDFFQIRILSPLHQIEMQKQSEKIRTAFFSGTLGETCLWSGNGVERGNTCLS